MASNADDSLTALATAFTNQKYQLEELKQTVDYIYRERTPSQILQEKALAFQAFGNAYPNDLESVSLNELLALKFEKYTPGNCVASLVGPNNVDLSKYFPESEAIPVKPLQRKWIGGTYREKSTEDFSTLILSWPIPCKQPVLQTLATLLGGGGAFSAGGPGKGMYSRFYLDILNTQGHVVNVATTGNAHVFSVEVSVLGDLTGMISLIVGLVSKKFTSEQVERAKKCTVSKVLMAREDGGTRAYERGLTEVMQMPYLNDQQVLDDIMAISAQDLEKCVADLFASPVFLGVIGSGGSDRECRRAGLKLGNL